MSERNPDSGRNKRISNQALTTIGRNIDALTDSDVLLLHREVCRRAAAIYGPMFKAKRDANYAASPAGAFQRARRARG